jgi:CBS domain containing-hemolysin-like protein
LGQGQRQLANGMFALAHQSIVHFAEPVSRLASVPLGSPIQEVLRVARRYRAIEILIMDQRWREPAGYAKAVEVQLQSTHRGFIEPRPLLVVGQRESPITVLNRLQSENQSLAKVVDDYGKTLGIVSDRALVEQLLNSR